MLIPTFSQAQNEKPDDPYIPSTAPHPTGPAYRISNAQIFTTQVNVNAAGQDILFDAANEPSIAVNPKNHNEMVIGWRQFDDINNNFRQAGYGYTTDGGQHWTFPGVIDPGVFRSDPVLDFNADGRFYYNSLTVDLPTNTFTCNVYKSTGPGTWDDGIFAYGGDKQWMTTDRTEGPGKGNTYAAWSYSYSACPGGNFTRSIDEVDSFEDCGLSDQNAFWGTMTVDPSGILYISSANGMVAKSATAQINNALVEWETFPAYLGGVPQGFQANSPNPNGLLGQTWIASNHAQNDLNGQLYILASIKPADDTLDVMFIRSADGGLTWSDPIRVNDDNSNSNFQWFGTMSVAPTGRIDAVWLDTRDNPGTYLSSLYYANSYDGGITWSANQRLSEAFDPHLGWPNQQKMGDYFHLISDSTGADLAWAGTFTGGENVYYSRIKLVEDPTGTLDLQANTPVQLLNSTPNPFSDHCTINYQLQSAGEVQIDMIDPLGRTVRSFSEGLQQSGRYSVQWDGKNGSGVNLPSGIYHYRLRFNNRMFPGKTTSLIR
ncbi:MAG: FlgD immunoglobulin-like domain containing protein [Bacteroidota bacterium]